MSRLRPSGVAVSRVVRWFTFYKKVRVEVYEMREANVGHAATVSRQNSISLCFALLASSSRYCRPAPHESLSAGVAVVLLLQKTLLFGAFIFQSTSFTPLSRLPLYLIVPCRSFRLYQVD